MKKEKNIIVIATVYFHVLHFHLPFIRLLQHKRYHVEVAAGRDAAKKSIQQQGIECEDICFTRDLRLGANYKAYKQLRALLRDNTYALIQVHTPIAGFLTRMAAWRSKLKTPILYMVHGFHFYKGAPVQNWLLYYTAEKIAARWTDGLIVINSEDYNCAQKLGFLHNVNLFKVNGVGVDLEKYSVLGEKEELRRSLGFSAEDKIVLCCAELSKVKNHKMLFKAWKKVVYSMPNAKLLIVGIGKLENILKSYVSKHQLPNIMFLGYRQDISELLNIADIFTLTSTREGLPKAIMEAMACAKPVVATNVRGNRDLIEDGVNGYLIEVGDIEGLAQNIIKLLENDSLAKTMGAKGLEKIESYSLDKVLKEMEAIYDRYLEG
jgi:glycosyltransferase involved in cell wall biosynthesis